VERKDNPMGLAVFLEDQIHGRTYCGPAVGVSLERMVADCRDSPLLAGVHPYGDTMFNVVQLQRLSAELDAIVHRSPQLESDVAMLKTVFEEATRSRGYVWISGD
jgi:hypothetical protein